MQRLLPAEGGGRFPRKREYGILVKELFRVSTIFHLSRQSLRRTVLCFRDLIGRFGSGVILSGREAT